ncbi:MAG: hypothetical protein AAGI52_14945 [Bacteroidota bacterium]
MYRLALLGLAVSLASCSSPAPVDYLRPAGVYQTTFGPLALTPPDEDGNVTGLYTGDEDNQAQLYGRYRAFRLTGLWWEPGREGPCEPDEDGDTYYGSFTFRFMDDGRTFEGTWSWCDGPEEEEWTGRYVKELPPRPM